MIISVEAPPVPLNVGEWLLCRQCDRTWRVLAVSLGEMTLGECEHAADVECSFCPRCSTEPQRQAGMTLSRPVATRRQLRVALKEALDGWEGLVDDVHHEHATNNHPNPCAREYGRIAELRKLVEE